MSESDPLPAHDALGALYREHHRWLHHWIRRRIDDSTDATDLAQDTFVRVLASPANLGRLHQLHQPRSFLATLAHRTVVDHLRRRALEKAWRETLAAQPEPVTLSPEARLVLFETLVEIDAMLDGLGPHTRQAFLWSQLEGLSYAEIGERLGVSVSAVKKHMARATEHCLRLMLADA